MRWPCGSTLTYIITKKWVVQDKFLRIVLFCRTYVLCDCPAYIMLIIRIDTKIYNYKLNGSYRTSFLRSVVSLQVNSSASATLNATKVAVTNGSLGRTWMVGPEYLFFDIYVCFCFLPEMGPQIGSRPTNLTSVRLCRSGGETGGGATWRVPGVYRSSLC